MYRFIYSAAIFAGLVFLGLGELLAQVPDPTSQTGIESGIAFKDWFGPVLGAAVALLGFFWGIARFQKENALRQEESTRQIMEAQNRILFQYQLGITKEKLDTLTDYLALFEPKNPEIINAYNKGVYLENTEHRKLEQRLLLLIEEDYSELIRLIKSYHFAKSKKKTYPKWLAALTEEAKQYCQALIHPDHS